uniref:PAP-associated domain-containing protein n=1 Tax=Heliothis virescens TaxID=7102 RepID=A0A2A4K0N2_HELVI
MYLLPGVLADQLCLTGDFAAQAQQLMDSRTMTSQHPNVTRLLDDMRATLNKRWQDFEMILHGSLDLGMGLTGASDVDLFVLMPINSSKVHSAVVFEAIDLLRQQPDLYSPDVRVTGLEWRPFFTFYHIPTQMYCDVGFGEEWYDSTGQLSHYFYNLDKHFLQLGKLIKMWCSAHELSGHFKADKMANYLWYLLTILYLQQKNLAPPVYKLQKHSENATLDSWDRSFEPIPYAVRNNESLYQLLGGFFQYYSQFDFQNYIVSPFAGRPIHRSDFLNVDRIPDEFVVYKNIVGSDFTNSSTSNLRSPLYIQNPFVHDFNLAHQMTQDGVSKIVAHMKWAAKVYEEFPSDQFLAAILSPIQDEVVDDDERGEAVHKLQDVLYNNCNDSSLL